MKNSLLIKIARLLPDKEYLSLKYYLTFGCLPKWNNPKSYNEKLQWLKLYNRNPQYTKMVDKFAVKDYVAKLIGDKYIIPTIGLWEKPEDIDWHELPNQFVLKTTHGGGSSGVVICRNKDQFNKQKAINQLNDSMKIDLYNVWREWPYKNVPKRVIAEKYIEEFGKKALNDYKIMCFDGKVKLIELHSGRFTDKHTQDFYDREWNLTKITQGSYGAYNTEPCPKPALLDEMIHLSEILAEGIPHVRVDWYIVNDHLYFGELTFFDGSGFVPWDRYEDDLLLGSWITLPKPTK